MQTKTKLTIRKIEKLELGEKPLWDTDVQGLHIRALKTGKYFYLFYRNKYGDQRKPSLGRYGAISLEQARDKARDWWHIINKGGDPSMIKKEEKENTNPTIQDLKDKWEKEHAPTLKTKNGMIAHWNIHILPYEGKKKVRDFTKKDAMRILNRIESKYTHNRVRSLLSKAFNLAEDWEWRDEYTNPIRKIPKKPEQKRERYMKPEEISALGQILVQWDNSTDVCKPAFANLIRLLMLTGARLREIMHAKWEYVDWHRNVLVLPDSKTGAKEIVLSVQAIQILENMVQVNDWIIPGRWGNNPLNSPSRLWKKLLEATGITNLRIHDLRHTFASTAMSAANGTLPQVGALLGHRQADTTKRYAHFMTDPKRDLANRTSAKLEEWMMGNIRYPDITENETRH